MTPATLKYLAAGAFLAAGGALAGWYLWPGLGAGLTPGNAEVVARGRLVYQENCAACHGTTLEGQANWQDPLADGRMPAPPHSAQGHTWHHDDALLIDLTTRGTQAVVGGGVQSDMPGFGEVLSASDIKAVLSFIKSTWPDEIKSANDNINAASGN